MTFFFLFSFTTYPQLICEDNTQYEMIDFHIENQGYPDHFCFNKLLKGTDLYCPRESLIDECHFKLRGQSILVIVCN